MKKFSIIFIVIFFSGVLILTNAAPNFNNGDGVDSTCANNSFGCHSTVASAPTTGILTISDTTPTPSQAGITMSVQVNFDNYVSTSDIYGVALRVGPSGSNANQFVTDDGWTVTADPDGAGSATAYTETAGGFSGTSTLTWTVTAPASVGTYYVQVVFLFDDSGASRYVLSEQSVTVATVSEFNTWISGIFLVGIIGTVLISFKMKKK